jgi:Zn-dependent protease/CBS domain-containing protein
MKQSARIGTLRGIAVQIHWSVLVIVALFAWELAELQLPVRPGHAGVADWLAATAGAVVLLLSLLAHEVSHALVARHYRVRVRSITLFVFGGVTQLKGEAHTPKADFRIAAVGPATSAALAGIFKGAEAIVSVTGAHSLAVSTLAWLWEVNLLLAGFNLFPAAPLDGGRILRAALWHHWHNRTRAAIAAARSGRYFGLTLVVLGVLGLLYAGISALWAALIGVFLYSGAVAEEQFARFQGALAGFSVRQVMAPDPPAVPGSTTLVAVLRLFEWRLRTDALVVTDAKGTPVGILTRHAVRRRPARQLQEMTADQAAIPIAMLPRTHTDEPASAALERILAHDGQPALVLDGAGRLVGVVSLIDLERATAYAIGGSIEG